MAEQIPDPNRSPFRVVPPPAAAAAPSAEPNGNGAAVHAATGPIQRALPTAAAPVAAHAVANFSTLNDQTRSGHPITIKLATPIDDIARQIYALTNGWPRRCAGTLFAHATGAPVRWLETPAALFAWLHHQAVGCAASAASHDEREAPPEGLGWERGSDNDGRAFVTREELHQHLLATAQRYDEIAEHPLEPLPEDVYLAAAPPPADAPATIEDAEAEILAFADLFRPASPADHAILVAAILTTCWGGPPGERPLFIVTGADASAVQGIGKTTLANAVAALVGDAFEPTLPRRGRNADGIMKQLVSLAARAHRCVLLDNTVGVFEDEELARAITAKRLHGRAAFERDSSRVNRITWWLTTNDLTFGSDLAARPYLLRIAPPAAHNDNWKLKLIEHVRARAAHIRAAVCYLLREAPRADLSGVALSRFALWERQVLAVHPKAADAVVARAASLEEIDVGHDELDLFEDHVRTAFWTQRASQFELKVAPKELRDLWNGALGGEVQTVWVVRTIRRHIARGKLRWLRPPERKSRGGHWAILPGGLFANSGDIADGGSDAKST